MITIKRVSEIQASDFDEIWAIVRYPKKLSHAFGKKLKCIYDLAPTSDLFSICQELKKDDDWHKGTFKDIYVPRFLKDLARNDQARTLLADLCREDKRGKRIALICYCSDERMCHRSIISGLLQGTGIEIDNSLHEDYSRYYKQYKAILSDIERK